MTLPPQAAPDAIGDAAWNALWEAAASTAIDSLASQGYAVWEDFLSPVQTAALYQQATQRQAEGAFRPAAIGRGTGREVLAEKRNDTVLWLEPDDPSPPVQAFWHTSLRLQAALNQALFLGLRRGEFHLACYPPGGHYRRHLDRFRDDDGRVVSTVFYLNPDWTTDDGGTLRLWPQAQDLQYTQDIAPRGGRLVLFLSDRIWHEVLPARRPRWSLTGWLRRDMPGMLVPRQPQKNV